jgi:hypothetical protein
VAHACNPSSSEIRRIAVWSQSRQIILETLSRKNPLQKGWGSGLRCRPWVQTPVPQKKKNSVVT